MTEHDAGLNLIGTLALKIHDLQMNAAVDVSGLSTTACACLISVAHQDTPQTISDIAAICNVSHSAAVRLVEKLELLGYVYKTMKESDGRKVYVDLTPDGYAMRDTILKARRSAIEPAVSKFSQSDWKTIEWAAGFILADLTESRLESEQICRLCDVNACGGSNCPVEKKALMFDGEAMA